MSEWTPAEIMVLGEGATVTPSLQALADRLSLSFAQQPMALQWGLELSNTGLTLIRPDGVKLCVDFTAGKTRHRNNESGQGAGVLRRALGLKAFYKRHNRHPEIVDGTGGWGQDAWAIASTGCEVSVIEQHSVVHALLEDALCRARLDDTSADNAERIKLVNANAVETLPFSTADVIYLDPMYPVRTRKKADSKKGMQFLHALLGPSEESASVLLLASALQSSAERVVVKRPKGSDTLPAPVEWVGQKTTIESPNTRYDVYLKR